MQIETTVIQGYLRAIAGMVASKTYEGIVLDHGQEYEPPVRPRPVGVRKGKNKLCFMNSYGLAFEKGWQYVEGYALSGIVPFPVLHAWVVTDSGEVIETTWKDSGVAYFGIPFDFDFIHKVLLETRTHGVIDAGSPSRLSFVCCLCS